MFTYEFICILFLCIGAFNVLSAGAFLFLTLGISYIREWKDYE